MGRKQQPKKPGFCRGCEHWQTEEGRYACKYAERARISLGPDAYSSEYSVCPRMWRAMKARRRKRKTKAVRPVFYSKWKGSLGDWQIYRGTNQRLLAFSGHCHGSARKPIDWRFCRWLKERITRETVLDMLGPRTFRARAIDLCFFEKESPYTAARRLKIPARKVRQNLRRGLHELRKKLGYLWDKFRAENGDECFPETACTDESYREPVTFQQHISRRRVVRKDTRTASAPSDAPRPNRSPDAPLLPAARPHPPLITPGADTLAQRRGTPPVSLALSGRGSRSRYHPSFLPPDSENQDPDNGGGSL